MNLEEIDDLLASLARSGDSELYSFYQKERQKLVKQIMVQVSGLLK